MTPHLDGIDHVHVYVTDRAAAERWYSAVLGFERVAALAFWSPGGGPLTLADRSGQVHLALFERAAAPCRSTIAFATGAAQFIAWLGHLESALGQPMQPVDHAVSWSVYFADPDGNPFEITSYAYDGVARLLRPTGGS